MIVSLQILKNSVENYKKKTDEPGKENFQFSGKYIRKGAKGAFELFILIIAIIFFIFELIFFYFAVMISIYCSKSKEERIINFVLSITFTTPFILLQMLFNPCAIEFIRNSKKN